MAVFARERDFEDAIAKGHAAFPAVPAIVIRAIIAQESAYKPDAVRGEPAIGDASRGLMQILNRTARSLGYGGSPEGLLDPVQNVFYGTKLLAQLYGQLREWDAVFSAYNGGVRPSLAFGARSTRAPFTVCLARDGSGRCIKSRTVQRGEFANQEYVNGVRKWLRYFGSGKLPGGRAASALVLLLPVALAALRLRGG